MAYQVLARKWRPQRFDDVVGQGGVTRTLKNAITSGRIAQAFVFAGPRGVGKTTTARILARALNCQRGPTAQPCGECEACLEIAGGRDIDVLEIDAATHTQVDKVRDVIISGLAIPPVRDRYKVFIIDEVHQLSGHSFNALLKSLEEPPPHIVFMMATTELQKIPETILSRAQVHEFRMIPESAIAGRLKTIADAEHLDASGEALALLARAADGSMRDGLTAFDQVLAFAGTTVSARDVSDVLGLVGRDLLLDIMEAVADERGVAAFELAGRATENGYDLRLLCRELSRLVRDLMLVSVDASRVNDPGVVQAGERPRVEALLKRFSREDLLRAFDLVARAEAELRAAATPRYHLEMALLKWIHLRKLTPLADLIEQLRPGGAGPPGRPSSGGRGRETASPQMPVTGRGGPPSMRAAPPHATRAEVEAAPDAQAGNAARATTPAAPAVADAVGPWDPGDAPTGVPPGGPPPDHEPEAGLKDAFLAEVRRTKVGFYKMTVEQAQSVERQGDRLVFSFLPNQRLLKDQLEQNRTWLEPLAARIAGRRVHVTAVVVDAPVAPTAGSPSPTRAPQAELVAEVAADPDIKTLLELLPLEIKDVEQI
jgi:DNA polymerase-3 subunit gamma/tau